MYCLSPVLLQYKKEDDTPAAPPKDSDYTKDYTKETESDDSTPKTVVKKKKYIVKKPSTPSTPAYGDDKVRHAVFGV